MNTMKKLALAVVVATSTLAGCASAPAVEMQEQAAPPAPPKAEVRRPFSGYGYYGGYRYRRYTGA